MNNLNNFNLTTKQYNTANFVNNSTGLSHQEKLQSLKQTLQEKQSKEQNKASLPRQVGQRLNIIA